MSLHLGDCLEVLRTLESESVDALVTDPPAGIGFMNVGWDSFAGRKGDRGHDPTIKWDQVGGNHHPISPQDKVRTLRSEGARFRAFLTAVAEECYRVLKPGAHGLVWAIPRTSHWTGTALEDAGFEVRDFVTHHFGSGFPKSLDVSKAIDKAAGAEREVIGPGARHNSRAFGAAVGDADYEGGAFAGGVPPITAPATEAAKQWQGWGTALKPATEVWWLVRKPLAEPNVASQVLATGTGALNVDGCRVRWPNGAAPEIGTPGWGGPNKKLSAVPGQVGASVERTPPSDSGRWPANLVLSCCGQEPHDEDCPVAELDRQSGELQSGFMPAGTQREGIGYHGGLGNTVRNNTHGDSGGASRFFYTAKASTAERNAGLWNPSDRNGHPTVKPVELMRWLCRLITPRGGTILDPFMGSGSTGVAANLEGFEFIGIEKDPESFATAQKRLAWAVHEPSLFEEENL